MYALEDEPESSSRWRRLGAGALLSAALLGSVGYGAQRFEPTRRLLAKVVQMTVIAELPKVEKLPPPRTEPPPPPPKRPPPQQQKSAAKAPSPPRPDNAPPPPSSEPVVGLDSDSFGAGAGASFQVGNTLMGEPTSVARAPAGPVAPPSAPAKLVPAGVPARVERCRYSSRAQRLGLEGMLIIEAEIDAQGLVTRADVRKPLEPELDRECLEAVRGARFTPASLAGVAVASTRFLRLRFELDR